MVGVLDVAWPSALANSLAIVMQTPRCPQFGLGNPSETIQLRDPMLTMLLCLLKPFPIDYKRPPLFRAEGYTSCHSLEIPQAVGNKELEFEKAFCCEERTKTPLT